MSRLGRLKLDRPLVLFDLETTGTDPESDRIVEISVCRVAPDGSREVRTRRINPGRPIPPEATAVHGIRDRDVAGAPSFSRIARSLLEFLDDADLAGFNVARFDLPLLSRELRRCELDLGLENRRIVDVMTIFHRKEPRDLGAAVRFYLGREHDGAHSAEADVAATAEILVAQLERYDDLPDRVEGLDRWCRPRDAVDRSGMFRWRDGEVVCAFGRKHASRPLREVIRDDGPYLEWFLERDFPEDAKRLVRDALTGRWPDPPGDTEEASGSDQST